MCRPLDACSPNAQPKLETSIGAKVNVDVDSELVAVTMAAVRLPINEG